jgi:hypothetical protein
MFLITRTPSSFGNTVSVHLKYLYLIIMDENVFFYVRNVARLVWFCNTEWRHVTGISIEEHALNKWVSLVVVNFNDSKRSVQVSFLRSLNFIRSPQYNIKTNFCEQWLGEK